MNIFQIFIDFGDCILFVLGFVYFVGYFFKVFGVCYILKKIKKIFKY